MGPSGHRLWVDQRCPGRAYPPGQHPESFRLDRKGGRLLTEGQFVLISSGSGSFWSEPTGS